MNPRLERLIRLYRETRSFSAPPLTEDAPEDHQSCLESEAKARTEAAARLSGFSHPGFRRKGADD